LDGFERSIYRGERDIGSYNFLRGAISQSAVGQCAQTIAVSHHIRSKAADNRVNEYTCAGRVIGVLTGSSLIRYGPNSLTCHSL